MTAALQVRRGRGHLEWTVGRNKRLTPRPLGTDSRNYGHAVEIAGASRAWTRLCCVAELPPAAQFFQTAVVFPLQHSDQCATSRNAGRDRIRHASATLGSAFLDAFGLGQRQSADGICAQGSALRSDAENRTVHGQDKFLALETAKFRSTSALVRRDASSGQLTRDPEQCWDATHTVQEKSRRQDAFAAGSERNLRGRADRWPKRS